MWMLCFKQNQPIIIKVNCWSYLYFDIKSRIPIDSAAVFFDNPMQHTGKGYYTKEGGETNSNNTSNKSTNSSNPKKLKASDGDRTCSKCGRIERIQSELF